MACRKYEFDNLPVEAVQLFSQQHVDFFSSLAWYKNWIDTVLSNTEKAFFLTYEDSGKLKLILPLKLQETNLTSLSNYYSPSFNILSCTTEYCRQDYQELFKGISDIEVSWNVLTLNAISKQQVFTLLADLKQVSLPSIPFFCFGNWYLEVNHRSFDQYFSTLSSRVKNTVTRKLKQFQHLNGTHIEIVTKGKGLEKAISEFQSIYALSWKDQETYPDFISGLIRVAAEQNVLRLGIAYLDGVAIAAQLWIVADKTAYIYKLAYDEKYKKMSAGSILTATLMRHVIDIDKVETVDYLSGDDAYKKEWMSHRRERWGIMIFNWRTWKGCLKMCNEFIRFYFKKYLL